MKKYLILLIAFTSIIFSCKNKSDDSSAAMQDEKTRLSKYFNAATHGIISGGDKLVYVLKTPINEEIPREKLADLVRINPEVQGFTSFSNGTVIEFAPEGFFQPDKEYNITVDLSILNSELKPVNYNIRTFKQDIMVNREGIIINDNNTISVTFSILTADVVNKDKLVECFQSDASAKEITKVNDKEYQLELIYKQAPVKSSYLSYNAESIGGTANGKIYFKDIELNKFVVLSSKNKPSLNEYHIFFSKRLSDKQDLTGLIKINDKNAKYSVKNNELIVYTLGSKSASEIKIDIAKGILSADGKEASKSYSFTIENSVEKPEAQFLKEGNYFPTTNDLKIPIKTKGLEKIRVSIVEIKQNNVKHFLAWHSLGSNYFYDLKMFGKPVYNEDVSLKDGVADEEGWKVFGIDLSNKIKKNPGSIYNISLSFGPEYTTLDCKEQLKKYNYKSKFPNKSFFNDSYSDMPYVDYDWTERNNPCNISFYNYGNSFVQRNFICSNYSVITKKAGKDYHFAVSDLLDLSPIGKAEVTLFDFQGDEIIKGTTSDKGLLQLTVEDYKAVVVKVKKDNNVSFMALDEGDSNPLTEFNISGNRSPKDGQFFIYTERNVWRPGDNIYLDVMANKSFGNIPKGLPIKLTFYNTENLIIDEQVQSIDLDKNLIYPFMLHTNKNAKSGMHTAVVEIGTQVFRKNIKVENIKPNTAEVIFDLNNVKNDIVMSDKVAGSITAQYLTGFPLKNAKITADAFCYLNHSLFEKYKDYRFQDGRYNDFTKFRLFELKSDTKGKGKFTSKHDFEAYNHPVKMFYEVETVLAGGGTNKEGKSVIVSPFESYIGAKKNKGSGWRGNYLFSESPKINLVSLSQDGKLNNSSKKIKYIVQKHVQYWWIDKYRLQRDNHFREDSYWKNIEKETIQITGKGEITFGKNHFKKGAYRIVIKDLSSGHITTEYFTVYDGKETIPGSEPQFVELETNKDEYNVEESVELQLPKMKNAKALVSVERSNKVLSEFWYDIGEKNTVSLTILEDWFPNVYVHVTILQKYEQEDNDLPLRLYGIKSIKINNSENQLKPVIDIPDKLESDTKYTLKVSEDDGKPMEYTVAVVDEGLLNLTGFSTPNPFAHFNGRFPLLVKTWDIYRYLMMYFKGNYAGIISIGGDDAYKADVIPEVSRFKAVVMHLGPFKLGANDKNKHEINIPNYIGKLRFMVVACSPDKFGSAHKAVKVKNPLMVQSRFPRSLNVSDKLSLPITVMKDNDGIKKAKMEIKSTAGFTKGLTGERNINLQNTDQTTENIDIEVLNKAGAMNVDISVSGSGKSMSESTEIAVNYPNSYQSQVNSKIVPKDEGYSFVVEPKGFKDVFTCGVQVSGLKVPKFTEYAEDLITYPYGCLEQVVSRGFAQLYLDKILVLTPEKNRERLEQLQAVINKLTRHQRGNGKFNYWESDYYNTWADLYAGNFLVELSDKETLPNAKNMLETWVEAHKKSANNWSYTEASNDYNYERESLTQAYRLFVLAKAGSPAKSAMNRFMTSSKSKNPLTWWLLGGAYKLSGYDTKAVDMIKKAEALQIDNSYNHYYWSYGDKGRDYAIIVEILSYFKDMKAKSNLYYNRMVDYLNDSYWVNTHTKGYSFLAANKYFGTSLDVAKDIQYDIDFGGTKDKSYSHSAIKPKFINISPDDFNKQIVIRNKSKGKIFVYKMDRFIDNNLYPEAKSSNLDISVSYFNMTKGEIGLDNLNVGDDVKIVVNVKNMTALAQDNLALNLKMPSGWELINPRMYKTENKNNSSNYVYQDYKDDRVYTFFNTGAGDSNKYEFRAKVSYSGDFYMPAVRCENMYNADIFAQTKSQRVVIKK